MKRPVILLALLATAAAWSSSPALRSPSMTQARCASSQRQAPLTKLRMGDSFEGASDRRGALSIFAAGLATLLSPAQAHAADGKSSNELQKDVANLEREVETYVKGAKSASDNAVALFKTAATNGNMSATKFDVFAKQGVLMATSAATLRNQSSVVLQKLAADEEKLGEAAVDKYEEAKELGKKGGDKASKLLTEGSDLKKKAKGKIQSQKDWEKIVAEVGKESAVIKAGGALNASKGLQLLSKSRTDAFKAMDIFKTGVKNMGDVKLFNDAGKMPNATKPLKMLKEAIVIMTAAEKDSAQAASEIKKIMSKTSESKGRIDKAILKAAPIVAEVEKSGKSVEKTLKAEQAAASAAFAALLESEAKVREFNGGFKNVLQMMKEAEFKYASADKAGLKSDSIYKLVTVTAQKEQDDLAKYRKKRMDATKKVAPSPPPEPAAPKATAPPPAPAPKAATPKAATPPPPPPAPKAATPPPPPPAPKAATPPPPPPAPKAATPAFVEETKAASPAPPANAPNGKPTAAKKEDDAFDFSQYLK